MPWDIKGRQGSEMAKTRQEFFFCPLFSHPCSPDPARWMSMGVELEGSQACGTWEQGTSFRYEHHSCTVAREPPSKPFPFSAVQLCSVPLAAGVLPFRGPVVASVRRIWQARPLSQANGTSTAVPCGAARKVHSTCVPGHRFGWE